MTEFIGKDIFNRIVVATSGNDGSVMISCPPDDDEDSHIISVHKEDVPKLSAWLASIQRKEQP